MDVLSYAFTGYGIGSYAALYPLVIASVQGRSAFGQHRQDGLPRATAYAAGAYAKGFASGLWNLPRFEMNMLRMAYSSLRDPRFSSGNKVAWSVGFGLGAALTVNAGLGFAISMNRLIRGRGPQRLMGLIGAGVIGYGLYRSIGYASAIHELIGNQVMR
ncbi:MAG: hypothetical protein ABIK43_03525 [candidate division WOR-3 bacterium]